MRIGVFFGERFEEIEGLTVVDILRRQGYDVETISVGHSHHVGGSHGIVFKADFVVDEVWFKTFDMLVLPGGPGHTNLEKCDLLMKYVKKFGEEGKFVAAICASPSILGRAGLLKGKKATCFPGFESELLGAQFVGAPAVTDGNVITGKGAGAAIEFGLALSAKLCGEDTAKKVRESMQCP